MASTIVKTIRIRQDLWQAIEEVSKREKKNLTQVIKEALESYISEKSKKEAVEIIENLPTFSLDKKPFNREEVYEDRC